MKRDISFFLLLFMAFFIVKKFLEQNYCWYADKTKEDHGSFSLDQYEQAEAVSK